jgi:hypothetical protein
MTVVERVFDITTYPLGKKFVFLAPFLRLTTLYRANTGESSTEIILILLILI